MAELGWTTMNLHVHRKKIKELISEFLEDLRETWNYPNDSALFHGTIEKWEGRRDVR